MPIVSIIVPVYNAEAFLPRCIESLLCQSFTDFEVLLIDDGSSDQSPLLCDQYVKADLRVHAFHQKNQGPAAARNYGVLKASGVYVTFIDADDFVPKDYLDRLIHSVTCYNADISVVLETECTNLEDVVLSYSDKYICCTGRDALRQTFKAFDSSYRSSWAKLIKRSLVLQNPFPADRSYSEDTATVYRWYHAAEKVVLNPSKLYCYVQNQSSLVHVPFNYTRLGIFKTYDEMLCFFASNQYEELCGFLLRKYICVACSHHNQVNNYLHDHETTAWIRKRIKFLLKQARRLGTPTLSEVPQGYNIAYPRLMSLYWTLKGLLTKSSLQK